MSQENEEVVVKRRVRFFIVDNELLDRYGAELGPYGIAAYCALARYANQSGECWPSLKTLAEKIGCGTSRLIKALKQMEELGLISREQRSSPSQGHQSTLYTMLEIDKDPPLVSQEHNPCIPQTQALVSHKHTNKTHIEQDTVISSPKNGEGKPLPLDVVPAGEDQPEEPSQHKKPNGKDLKRGELENYFADLTNLPPPKRDTVAQRKVAARRWWNPLREILDLTDWDVGRAKSLVRQAYDQMKRDKLTISAPASVIEVTLSVFADGGGRAPTQVSMNGNHIPSA